MQVHSRVFFSPDLASSYSAECVNESQLDGQISHSIHILVTFLHHLGNSLIRTESRTNKYMQVSSLLISFPGDVLFFYYEVSYLF